MELKLIEVKLKVDSQVIKETLTRIGICNSKKKVLFPSCYLYQKDDKYYVCHFKELFLITKNNGYNNISDEDIKRRNAIIFCLKNWNMVDIDEKEIIPHDIPVFILPYKEKRQWLINHKINLNSIERTNETNMGNS